ncbi:MAG: type II secretion system secretin GspD [Thermodesulfobacteriota bacterium]|nr:type II secretion system secretin GspD [Thermodesulfobacteriota bacterium]
MVIRRGVNILLSLCLLLVVSVSQLLAEQKGTLPGGLEVTLDFQNVELVDMIGTISELTGKNFVYDESVRGKVTIISPEPVSVAEAYRLFSTVLKVKGFTIIPSGKVNKIVPTRHAKEENLPVSDGERLGEQFITRLIELKNLDATVVANTVLRPLMPKTSHVVAHAATNTVVLTDSAANISRLAKILTSLDQSWAGQKMEIVPLRFSEADETAKLVLQILGGGAAAPVRGVKPGVTVRKKVRGQVVPYERTNKLLLLGDVQFIRQTKKLIAQLDEKADLGHAGVHVYYLEHAEAESLSATLNKIITVAKKDLPPKQNKDSATVFGDIAITADKPTNAVIINATIEDYESVKSLIRQLDIKRKQVFVEVLILELSMDALMDLGTSLQGAVDAGSDSLIFGTSNTGNNGLAAFTPTDGVPNVLAQAVDGILLGGMFNPITTVINGESVTVPALSALIGLSQVDANVNVLSAPRLLTSDNEEAEIIVGKNVPIITSKSTDNAGNPINSVERQDAALTLRFTPQITEGNLVRLEIFQEISAVTDSVGTVDEVGPTFKKTLLRNSIVARDGETVVLGGLFQTDTTKSVTGVPLLKDLPVLGHLFKRTKEVENKTSLLIFITPRVIRNSVDLERITRENRANLDLFQSEGGSDKFFGLEGSAGSLSKSKVVVED